MSSSRMLLLACVVLVVLLPSRASAFGAGNIASISTIEGHNWRHGDIEDMLKTVAFLRGHKWTSMMIKRVYFGNWLRDYSQAVDVGTLKGVQADTIRVLVWVLSFMSFGYATAEFEVTTERLGVYRPEEHIDNPKDYAENVDARQFDARLRGPISPLELAVDPTTGMKNYIANENGAWATSLGYIKYSFARSIHFGRLYTHGAQRGREEDLCEALRCLGQGLHCVEDFGAHTNYVELVLREIGYHGVFPHVGTQTMINLHGKQVFPLVTGTFGGVDFLHSVLGEATDHVTQTEVNQSEVDQMNNAISQAAAKQNVGKRGVDPAEKASGFTNLLAQVPGTGGLIQEAVELQAASDAQAAENERLAPVYDNSYTPYGNEYNAARAANANIPTTTTATTPGGGMKFPAPPNVDPKQVIAKIYPIFVFRDKVVRTIAGIVSKVPGLEKAIETISEKVTLFVMGLLAPFIKPVIAAASNALKQGSGTVVDASAHQQFLVWTDPTSTDPTHSMLSKDHFSNILNPPAGQVAAIILQYVAPRVIYGWDHPEVPEQEIMNDIGQVFHHPAMRHHNLEIHRNMFSAVEKWAQSRHGYDLNHILGSDSVKAGKNHKVQKLGPSVHGLEHQLHSLGTSSHSATAGGPLSNFLTGRRELDLDSEMQGTPSSYASYDQPAGFAPGDVDAYPTAYQQGYEAPHQPQHQPPYDNSYGQPQYQGYQQDQGYQQGAYSSYDQNQGGYDQQGGYGRY